MKAHAPIMNLEFNVATFRSIVTNAPARLEDDLT